MPTCFLRGGDFVPPNLRNLPIADGYALPPVIRAKVSAFDPKQALRQATRRKSEE
jgi:hypothetical protein